MRAIFVLFDSLNRTAMGCYGARAVKTPNFDRFAERAVTFDTHFVGSLPCMPARRDLHTGRLNFMHRSWGPLEPFDNSFPEMMREKRHPHASRHRPPALFRGRRLDLSHPLPDLGVHPRPGVRSLEGDGPAADRAPVTREHSPTSTTISTNDAWKRPQSADQPRIHAGRKRISRAAAASQSAFEFLESNRTADDWFLMVECFDPHEPFFAPARFKEPVPHRLERRRARLAATTRRPLTARRRSPRSAPTTPRSSPCAIDYFGQLLDYFDAHGLWKDTALILSTDHGFLLAEHDWWGKNLHALLRGDLAHPAASCIIRRHAAHAGSGATRSDPDDRSDADLARPLRRRGAARGAGALAPAAARPRRDAAARSVIFGMFGGPIGATDGRYAYYLYPEDLYAPGLHEYTLMPMHLHTLFSAEEMKHLAARRPLRFHQGHAAPARSTRSRTPAASLCTITSCSIRTSARRSTISPATPRSLLPFAMRRSRAHCGPASVRSGGA